MSNTELQIKLDALNKALENITNLNGKRNSREYLLFSDEVKKIAANILELTGSKEATNE